MRALPCKTADEGLFWGRAVRAGKHEAAAKARDMASPAAAPEIRHIPFPPIIPTQARPSARKRASSFPPKKDGLAILFSEHNTV